MNENKTNPVIIEENDEILDWDEDGIEWDDDELTFEEIKEIWGVDLNDKYLDLDDIAGFRD
jgi:hypothetical protein